VGRTTAQIHAYNTNSPTEDDLQRWARRDAEPFLARRSLPAPGPPVAAWAEQLNSVASVAEFHAVLDAVFGTGDEGGSLTRLTEFLDAAADWCRQHGAPQVAERYRDAAERLSLLDRELYAVGIDHLATEHQRSTATPGPRPSAVPPASPGAAGHKGPTR
jgi:hypothetical protein